uniref:Uncharacterized protein n=1 Tax=Salix viminalis TaxID=40686 RepID=A0A6N2KEI5_SALVM
MRKLYLLFLYLFLCHYLCIIHTDACRIYLCCLKLSRH